MKERDHLLGLCNGNHDAVDIIMGAWELAEVYDDAIDGQKGQTDAEIHGAFHWALFGLQDNRFYRTHPELRAALQASIVKWRAANALEQSPLHDHVRTAWVLRCAPYDFFVAVVLAAGGIENAVAAAMYFYGRPTPDSFDAYLAEHSKGDVHGMGPESA